MENLVRIQMDAFFNIYRGKRVFVTGHTGFKGSWLTIWLLSLGAEVIGYSKDIPTVPSNFEACRLDKRINHIFGDVEDSQKLWSAIETSKPEIVFHLAAQSLVKKSYLEPKLTFDTNAGGGVNVLEAARRSKTVKALIYITSDKCYENRELSSGYSENDRLGGSDPYSASKACAEIIFSSYSRSFFPKDKLPLHGKGVASVRAGNVVGGGDWAKDRVVPDCIRALVNGKRVKLRNPESIRPWQHVLEPLGGYLWIGALLLKQPEKYSGESWNFGPLISTSRTVRELAESIISKWGRGEWERCSEKKPVQETVTLRLNCDKARNKLSWQACLRFDEMAQMVVDWYKAYYRKRNPYECCIRQIEEYTAKAKERNSEWAGSEEKVRA